LNAFSRTLGSNSFKDRIRIVPISPGAVETERLVTLMKARAEKEFGDAARSKDCVSGLPHGGPATVEEAANVAAFVVSARASCLSGNVIDIDDGYSARGGAFWLPNCRRTRTR
jgi:NAD(P)-dependent dehydrogenase (short-subunit alcohol dehydrogenase family)